MGPRLASTASAGLILIYSGGALGFNTWLMKGYFDTLPFDLDESAMVDGATDFQAFWLHHPAADPSHPGGDRHPDFHWLLLGLPAGSSRAERALNNYTLAVGMTLFLREYQLEWGTFAAAALIGALPIVVVFLVLQRQLIGGLAQGGVKG